MVKLIEMLKIFIRDGENVIDSTTNNDFLLLTELGIKQDERVKRILY